MKISYNWLKEYLPEGEKFDPFFNSPEKLGEILTAVGLEVEGIEYYESVPGALEGLIVAEVLTCEQHPNADRLKVTTVNTGLEILKVVCGAPNVNAGQKVILAPAGTKVYPVKGEPFQIKKSKIRGEESNGMICSEDEIGLGSSHEGIVVLPDDVVPGTPVSKLFPVYKDYIIEIGLTPNRMDAQSHLGVAKDVCAWLSHHTGQKAGVVTPLGKPFKVDDTSFKMNVEVKNPELCVRYAGIVIRDVTIQSSPEWLKNKLKSIGLKLINNVVDLTNFILHATGQPLHAFDADKIKGKKVVVETLAEGTSFITLDEKQRKLSAEDIMICDGEDTPLCIAGVFGGIESGVTEQTKNIFLESAVFNPVNIRKSMIRHGLRTDAGVRFEKGVDIGKTVEVLKYAASLIAESGKGTIASGIYDLYEAPPKREVYLSFSYLKKLSGKEFDHNKIKGILESLGFVISNSEEAGIRLDIPTSNPDITLPADVVEEILRIDGLDNIEMPSRVTMAPGIHDQSREFAFSEKISSWLVGNGFSEIFTNSIVSADNVKENEEPVHILNSLSEELTTLRTNMLPSGLESIAYNLNRQNKDLLLFEYGKTYSGAEGKYIERNCLAIYCTGLVRRKSWNTPESPVDIYFAKGVAQSLFFLCGIAFEEDVNKEGHITFLHDRKEIGTVMEVKNKDLERFGIRQPVYYLIIDIEVLRDITLSGTIEYKVVNKFPTVTRDLAMIVKQDIAYLEIEKVIRELNLKKLSGFRVFDLYENEKLGNNRKSIAMSFSFVDFQKTLTDSDTDAMMQKVIKALNEKVNAEIRSHV